MIVRFLLIISFSLFLFGDDKHHHEGKHYFRELSHINLDNRQKASFNKLLKEFRGKIKEYRKLKEMIEKQQSKLFQKSSFNLVEMERLNSDIHLKAQQIEVWFLEEAHKILRVEQRGEFLEYFDDWRVE